MVFLYGMEVAENKDQTVNCHHIGMIFARKNYLTIFPPSYKEKT